MQRCGIYDIRGIKLPMMANGKLLIVQDFLMLHLKVVVVNDTKTPNQFIMFFSNETAVDKNDQRVKTALEQVSRWNSRISILIKRADEEVDAELKKDQSYSEPLDSVALSELKKEGIITQEVFEAQKFKLLNK